MRALRFSGRFYVALGLGALFFGLAREGQCSCGAPANAIEAENCLPGNPSKEWDITHPNDADLVGYPTEISYAPGETVHFKIKTTVSYQGNVYRLGWYGGAGARKVGSFTGGPQSQPNCMVESFTQLLDCGNWTETNSWTIPPDARSGIYIVKLTSSNGLENQMVFIIREDSSHSDILMMTVDTTWQAYNRWADDASGFNASGGVSLYRPINPHRAYKVSFNRPLKMRGVTNSSVFDHEYAMIRWLEKNGYDVTYFTHIDANRRGDLMKNHRVILVSGHDEYYSLAERTALTAARDAGVNLALLTGNNMGWKIRWDPSLNNDPNPFRTEVCYKSDPNGAIFDPKDPPIWTGGWDFGPTNRQDDVGSGMPANALSGQTSAIGPQPYKVDTMRVPADDGRLRFWRNTSAARLAPGQEAQYPETLGYEWDADFQTRTRPINSFRLDHTPLYGFLHSMTIYRHKSGALVWGAGTMEWSWNLDPYHNQGSHLPPNRDIEQATVNFLADCGVQPVSLQSDLSPATRSTDFTPPNCTVTGPKSVQAGQTVTITGTAADAGGGVVSAVVVSLDSGRSFFLANGREQWNFTGTARANGTVTCLAVDDSGNIEGLVIQGPVSNVPQLQSLNPGSAMRGGPSFRLNVRGINFQPNSQVLWNGQPRPTIFISANSLSTTISSADLAKDGTAMVTVMTPGLATTAAAPFLISVTSVPLGSDVRVYPNPWKAHLSNPQGVTIDNVQTGADVKIFTLSAHWVRTLQTVNGSTTWDLKNDAGEPVASGYYLYLTTDPNGQKVHGKFAVVR